MLVTYACNNVSSEKELSEEINKVKKEAIEKHDIVMAQMGAVRSLKDSLLSIKGSSDHSNEELQEKINKLKAADKAMWDWMHNFNMKYEAETDSATLKYFQQKVSDIDKVSKQFEEALSVGDTL